MIKSECVVIVDGYSSGKFLRLLFEGNGIECVHVQSRINIPKLYLKDHENHVKKNYLENIIYVSDEQVVRELKKYNVRFIMPGSESGVGLADTLTATILPQFKNTTDYFRRSKYLVNEMLAAEMPEHKKFLRSVSLDEILNWKQSNRIEKCVLKPVDSAASDNVHICTSKEDIEHGFESIKNALNFTNEPNKEVLCEEFLVGEEYVVNTVSYEGEHVVTDIWTSKKKYVNGHPLYDRQDIVHPQSDIYKKLEEYVYRCLNVLGTKFGASHFEIMYTKKGPMIIEVGARLAGGMDPSAITKAIGINQVTALASVYLYGKEYIRFLQQFLKNGKFGHYTKLLLISRHSGQAIRSPSLEIFKGLPTFHSMHYDVPVNQKLSITIDRQTCPGCIFLVSPDRASIEWDYDTIRAVEDKVIGETLVAV